MIWLPIQKFLNKCFDAGRIIFFLGVLVYFIPADPVWGGEIVALVNKDAGATEMSYRELRKIYKGEKKFWGNQENIVLFIPPSDSAAMDALVNKIFKARSRSDISKFYLTAIFRQIFSVPPTSYSNQQDAVYKVSHAPGGITLIELDGFEPGDSVQVIRLK